MKWSAAAQKSGVPNPGVQAKVATPEVVAVVEFYLVKIIACNRRRDKEARIAAQGSDQSWSQWPICHVNETVLETSKLNVLVREDGAYERVHCRPRRKPWLGRSRDRLNKSQME